uniref:protein FAM161B isoform X2 n=1 Tax=Monopterus albus TaxID=43700 RepID=UPI0009B4DC88|nr:protein FAM161B isoform X2 [Monopterus albus]
MSKVETLLQDGLSLELMLQEQLRVFSNALTKQFQETESRQKEELERRIHQNALLPADVDGQSDEHQAKRSSSLSNLMSEKETSHPSRKSYSPAWLSLTNGRNCSIRTSMLTPTRTQQCERAASSKTTQMRKEEEAEAECQNKFCAAPAPSHVSQLLFQEMMEMREKERKQAFEQRQNFWLSTQKPFSFEKREMEKREKLIAMLNQVSHDQKNEAATVRKPPHKAEKDVSISEPKGQEEVCKKVSIQTKVRQDNPATSGSPKLRTAEHTRKEKLGFMDEKPSFRPKIIRKVPDFSRLHKALQTEVLRKAQCKDVTKCQPFSLRTSALPARQSKMSPKNSQEPKISNLNRSKSLGALTSLSTDTLPIFITDAARKRCMAIRKSMEIRDSKNQESAEWSLKHQMRSQAMKKTVALHAKLLDPHISLKEVYNEKLQRYREADQQRMREYNKELRDMKARVSERPYLFEQLKQRNAKALAEQAYRNKLKKAGLKEEFVEDNSEAADGVSTSSRAEDDMGVNDCSTESDIHIREENVDDGEKIEDLEEKSVKSKREEMP